MLCIAQRDDDANSPQIILEMRIYSVVSFGVYVSRIFAQTAMMKNVKWLALGSAKNGHSKWTIPIYLIFEIVETRAERAGGSHLRVFPGSFAHIT